jgi:ASC-1-like (ASCH) protein
MDILDGIKTVEARCFEEEYDRIRRGGSMVMINKCLMFEVLELHQYASFYELLKAESSEKVFPGTKTVEEGSYMIRIKRISMVLWQSILVNQLLSLVLLWLTYCLA